MPSVISACRGAADRAAGWKFLPWEPTSISAKRAIIGFSTSGVGQNCRMKFKLLKKKAMDLRSSATVSGLKKSISGGSRWGGLIEELG